MFQQQKLYTAMYFYQLLAPLKILSLSSEDSVVFMYSNATRKRLGVREINNSSANCIYYIKPQMYGYKFVLLFEHLLF